MEKLLLLIISKQKALPLWVNNLRGAIFQSVKELPDIVFIYGSRLYEKLATSTSMYDLFFIYNNSRISPFKEPYLYLISFVLPPTIQFRRLMDEKGNNYYAKVNYLYFEQVNCNSIHSIADLHLLGRLTKRVGLLFAKTEEDILNGALLQLKALWFSVPLTIAILPKKFSTEQFALTLLSLSYRAEVRIKEKDKVRAIFELDKGYYLTLFETLLDTFFGVNPWGRRVDEEGLWELTLDEKKINELKVWYNLIIFQSRIRSVLRWPKYMLTVGDSWLEYILLKLVRHTGIELELPEVVKRHPLIFGWPYFMRLIKDKVVTYNIAG